MARLELIKELKLRERELVGELNAIRALIDQYKQVSISEGSSGHDGSNHYTSVIIEQKGKRAWTNYVEYVLTQLGGRAKAREVASAISEVDTKYSKERIIEASAYYLSLLYREDRIGAETSDNKKEGYTYFIK
jgi:hypothetical protein